MHRVQFAKAPPGISYVPPYDFLPSQSFFETPPREFVRNRMYHTVRYMTLDQKQLVQKTWEKVLPISNTSPVIRLEIITHE